MKKPSDRIREIADRIAVLHSKREETQPFLLTPELITGMNVSAVIEFLDEWFEKTEFRNVGHFQVLTQKTKPIKIDGVETVKGDSAEGFTCENCGHMTVVKIGGTYKVSSEKQ